MHQKKIIHSPPVPITESTLLKSPIKYTRAMEPKPNPMNYIEGYKEERKPIVIPLYIYQPKH